MPIIFVEGDMPIIFVYLKMDIPKCFINQCVFDVRVL